MQYITIKQEEQNGELVFLVNAILLKNKNKTVVQKIPHPLGTDMLSYKTLDEAKNAISRAGFDYILPDGKKVRSEKVKPVQTIDNALHEDNIYNAIRSKISSSSSRVAASAVLAISEFPTEETFDILFEIIGEENETLRKNAISGICRYGKILQDRIITALSSDNWITRNSALYCISNLTEDSDIKWEKYIPALIKATDDTNPIVQSNAITTLASVYRSYKKFKNS
ncbi:hypothetical protein HDR58_00230 [bacterium]|nr:hypothetical protein [bacterium]